jgi:hypothetical protein
MEECKKLMTVDDFKKFIEENNIPDDAEICFSGEMYNSFIRSFKYDNRGFKVIELSDC